MESLMVVEKIPEGEKNSVLERIFQGKKVPIIFMSDLFDEDYFCCYQTSSLDLAICCRDCAYDGTIYCKFVKQLNQKKHLCVEEEEVITAVADAGKSSERDSDKLDLDSPERSVVLNP